MPVVDSSVSVPAQPGVLSALFGAMFGSKLFLAALVCTLIGGGMWVYSAIDRPDTAVPPATPNAAGSFAAGDARQPAAAEAKAVDGAPLPFRAGLGFMGGFFLAWMLRKFIKLTLLVGGAIAVAIGLLKWSGVVTFDWAGVETAVESGLGEAREHAGAARDWLTSVLPSGIATMAGLFVGARRG
jgi:uncharacterized membrane protein (Fun14 family)